MKFDITELDVVADVINCFQDCQNMRTVLKEFTNELQDMDDAPLVYLGLCAAYIEEGLRIPDSLKTKVFSILDSTNLEDRFKNEACYPDYLEWKERFVDQINFYDEKRKEQKRASTRFYNQLYKKTQIGDVYATCLRKTGKQGEKRWVVYRVFGKDDPNKHIHVYIMSMPDFTIPTEQDFSKLIYIPVSIRFRGFDYRFSIFKGNENTEETKRLCFIGNYPNFSKKINEVIAPEPVYYRYVQHDEFDSAVENGIELLIKYTNNNPFIS